jgi:hypothetical protein
VSRKLEKRRFNQVSIGVFMQELFRNPQAIKNLAKKFLKRSKEDLSYLEKKGVFTIFSWNGERIPENFKLLLQFLIKSCRRKLKWQSFLRILFQGYGYLLARKIHWHTGQTPEENSVKHALRCAVKKFKLQHDIIVM